MTANRVWGRRGFVSAATVGCAFCRLALRASAEEVHGASAYWTYQGEAGDAHWGELSPAFKACEFGTEQSPIDLANAITAEPGNGDIAWAADAPAHRQQRAHHSGQRDTWFVLGASVAHVMNCSSFIFITRANICSPASLSISECHFVHRSAAGGLAVIGVFVRPGVSEPGTATDMECDAAPRGARAGTWR